MKFFLTVVSLLLHTALNAGTYYISSVDGNDSRRADEAKNMQTPWKSLNKVNEYFSNFQAGDTIALKRGDTFQGPLHISGSGIAGLPIVVSAYGIGNKPIITGFLTLINWQSIGNGISTSNSNLLGAELNMLTVNGSSQALGRFPNHNDVNGGYLALESHQGDSKITDNELNSREDWTGGQLVIRKNRWIIDRHMIISNTKNTISYRTQSEYSPIDSYGYFISNHPLALDVFGEWCFQSQQKNVSVYFGNHDISSTVINASYIDELITVDNQSFIVLDNISLTGSNRTAISLSNVQFLTVSNTEIDFSGVDAVKAEQSNHLIFDHIQIRNTNNNAFSLYNCDQSALLNSSIKNTGVTAGMGSNGDMTYHAVIIQGKNNLLENNNIDSTGYIPIRFQGDNVTIKNNFINNFTLIKDDGGGIYTWKGASDNVVNLDRKIIGNIILNGKGAPQGTDSHWCFAHGIYIDDNSQNVEILENTIADCGNTGIFIHNSYNVSLRRNTIFNNPTQLQMVHDQHATQAAIRKVVLENNNMFCKDPTQLAVSLSSTENDIDQFGVFDGNYYCRPLDERLVLSASSVHNSIFSMKRYDLEQWKSSFNFDKNSQTFPQQLPSFHLNSITGINKFSNGSFESTVSNVSSFWTGQIGTISWKNESPLDKGALQIAYQNPPDPSEHVIVNFAISPLKKGKNYLIKCSLIAETDNNVLEVFFRKTSAAYTVLSAKKYFSIKTKRSDIEFVLCALESESNPSLIFEIGKPNGTVWVDNVQIYEANVSFTNPEDNIIFKYNSGLSNVNIPLPGVFVDERNNQYDNSITLPPNRSVTLVKSAQQTVVRPRVTFLTQSLSDKDIAPNSENNPLYILQVRNTASQPLTFNSFELKISGTYQPVDIQNFKLMQNTVPSVDSAVLIGNSRSISGNGEKISFKTGEVVLAAGSTTYFILAVSIASSATLQHTLYVDGLDNPEPLRFVWSMPVIVNSQSNLSGVQRIHANSLPVVLSSFKLAEQTSGRLISWQTTSETDNAGFELQRSTDGFSFVSIAHLDANNSVAQIQTYQYLDTQLFTGGQTLYYRLKQIDTNGKATTSRIIFCRIMSPEKKMSIYPNPAINYIIIKQIAGQPITLRWYSLNGKAIGSAQQLVMTKTGEQFVPCPDTFPSGMYILEVHTTLNIERFKVIKQEL